MDNNLIFGIRPVVEAIEAGREIEKLYIRKGAEGQLMTELRDLCLRHRVRVQEVPVEKLNRLVRGNHQGVVAQIAAIAYVQLDDILERVPDDETPLVVVFDGVTDVRNFGAIAARPSAPARTGLIAPSKNSAPGQRRSDPSIGRARSRRSPSAASARSATRSKRCRPKGSRWSPPPKRAANCSTTPICAVRQRS